MESTQQGTMLIADITGYTQYLSASELDHAREVLKALLELLINHTKPPLVISRLAGDAVISYGLQGRMMQGQTFVEMIENTYVAFRRAIDLMVMNNTCQCNACRNISNLDLKFFVHYGKFGIDRLGGHDEMVGADVIVLHRLLKNHVTEKTGFRAYTLYSDAAIQQLGLDAFCEKLAAHQEEYEHLGVVNVWIQDMHPVWQEKQGTLRLEIPPEQVMVQIEHDFGLPPEVIWDYVTTEEYRSLLIGANIKHILNRTGGRVGPGSVYRCYHGGDMYTNQVVLEWQPFEQYTTEGQTFLPKTTMLNRIQLTPTAKGTHVTVTFAKTKGPVLFTILMNMMSRLMFKQIAHQMTTALKERFEKEIAEGRLFVPELIQIPTEHIYQEATASLMSV